MKYKDLTIDEFLELIYEKGLSSFDIYEYAQEKTNNFEKKRLELIIERIRDFVNHIDISYMKRLPKSETHPMGSAFPEESTLSRYLYDWLANFRNSLNKKSSCITSEEYDSQITTMQNSITAILECKSIKDKNDRILSFSSDIWFNKYFKCIIEFSDMLQLEYNKIEAFDSQSYICKDYVPFQSKVLLSETKNIKIDYIHVINCLYELGFFTDLNGNKITKDIVINSFGEIVNKNFSRFQQDLSNAKNAANADQKSLLRIFNKMTEKQIDIISNKTLGESI